MSKLLEELDKERLRYMKSNPEVALGLAIAMDIVQQEEGEE